MYGVFCAPAKYIRMLTCTSYGHGDIWDMKLSPVRAQDQQFILWTDLIKVCNSYRCFSHNHTGHSHECLNELRLNNSSPEYWSVLQPWVLVCSPCSHFAASLFSIRFYINDSLLVHIRYKIVYLKWVISLCTRCLFVKFFVFWYFLFVLGVFFGRGCILFSFVCCPCFLFVFVFAFLCVPQKMFLMLHVRTFTIQVYWSMRTWNKLHLQPRYILKVMECTVDKENVPY